MFPAPAEYFKVDLRDPGRRADLLLPILDALIDGQRNFEGRSEADRVRARAEAARNSDWVLNPFRPMRLKGFQELWVLLGENTLVPRKEHVTFVNGALGREVDVVEALYLLERAAEPFAAAVRTATSYAPNESAHEPDQVKTTRR